MKLLKALRLLLETQALWSSGKRLRLGEEFGESDMDDDATVTSSDPNRHLE